MKTIILMRHSHASSDNPAWSDHERPLTQRGKDLAKVTAALLAESIQPDRILCSSAVRTRETAAILSTQFPETPTPESVDSLYLSPAGEYLRVAAEVLTNGDQTVLFVGHNPGIANLINSWTDDYLPISPATIAISRLNVDDWQSISSESSFVPELSGVIAKGTRIR